MLSQSRSHVLNDLYDGLYLQSMLQQCQMRHIKNRQDSHGQGRPASQHIERERNEWECFLDNLCLLCDSHRGGRTTTSIGVTQRSGESIFCVATNSGSRPEARDYLTTLLRCLQPKDRNGAGNSDEITYAVFENAVKRSPQRVSNYASRLSNIMEKLRKQSDLDEESSIVLDQLGELLRLRPHHVLLCNEAYRFRRTEAFRRLLLNADDKQYNSWYQVRHYLGRLGTWYKAAKEVVASSATFADVLVDSKVKWLSPRFEAAPPALAFDEEPEVVLSRVLPNYRDSGIFADALSRILGARSQANHLQRGNLVPAPHAEAVVLHHFLSHGLRWAHGIRYVGCSKPSCYCCRVFFESHPTAPRVGRSHNNVWIKWRLPGPIAGRNGESDGVRVEIVRRMVDSVYKDLRTTLVHNGVPSFANFDSTTGLTTSMASFGMTSG